MAYTVSSNLKSTLLALFFAFASTAHAQLYPQTENGSTVYYKLVSACSNYSSDVLCLQDVSRTNDTYAFTLSPLDNDASNQEWVLICANQEQETYHLRNRATYRYISTDANWAGNFKVPTYATKLVTSNALAITDLGDGQVAISYEDTEGKRYLSATDINQEQPSMAADLKNTQWAWKVMRSSDLANGIYETCTPNLQIWVENRHIRVNGTDHWTLTDISGMPLPNEHPVQSGHIYIIKAKGQIHKFLVK